MPEQDESHQRTIPSLMDSNSLEAMEDPSGYTPPEIHKLGWSWNNEQYSLGKMSPRQAEAQIHRANAFAQLAKVSKPRRRATTKFILDLENFKNHVKTQAWRTVPPNTERVLVASSFSNTEVKTNSGAPRKKWLGFI